jgi:hypothetical protein
VLSEPIHSWSPDLAALYEDVPVPRALEPMPQDASVVWSVVGADDRFSDQTLADPSARVMLLVGPLAMTDLRGLHRVAHELGAPVANTWGAKGIYRWDAPHHMGTCGLQRDDFALLGLNQFDLVLSLGLDPAEAHPEIPDGTHMVAFEGDLMRVPVPGAPRHLVPANDNALFRRISAIAQPGYVDDAFPRHPARAVMDLKQSLGPGTRVVAPPGPAGLWVARTFPTDVMGSVVVPAYDRPGIAAAVALVSAWRGAETVCVVTGTPDDATRELMALTEHHELPVRYEMWSDDVDWSRTEDLIAAAGPVVAWTS